MSDSTDSEPHIGLPTLSDIAKELFQVEARYATQEAKLRKQITALELKVGLQKAVVESQFHVISYRESQVSTLTAELDALKFKWERSKHYPPRNIRARLPPSPQIHVDNQVSSAPNTDFQGCKKQADEASGAIIRKASSQPHRPSHSEISSIEPGTRISYFKRLPLAVQHKIWRLTFVEPRIVEFVRTAFSGYKLVGEVPTALHICHDSRQVALQVYRNPVFFQCNGRVDWKRDTIYMSTIAATEGFWAGELLSDLRNLLFLKDIRHFAIRGAIWKGIKQYEDELYELLNSMTELQELTLVLGDNFPETGPKGQQRIDIIDADGVDLDKMMTLATHTLKNPRWRPLFSKIRIRKAVERPRPKESSDSPVKIASTPINIEYTSTKSVSTPVAVASSSAESVSTPITVGGTSATLVSIPKTIIGSPDNYASSPIPITGNGFKFSYFGAAIPVGHPNSTPDPTPSLVIPLSPKPIEPQASPTSMPDCLWTPSGKANDWSKNTQPKHPTTDKIFEFGKDDPALKARDSNLLQPSADGPIFSFESIRLPINPYALRPEPAQYHCLFGRPRP